MCLHSSAAYYLIATIRLNKVLGELLSSTGWDEPLEITVKCFIREPNHFKL